MFHKIAASALLLSACWGLAGTAVPAHADSMLWGRYGPEGTRIPASIELLENTPYYAGPDQPEDQAEGTFAPQTVKVLRTDASWSVGASAWEIETMFGPRWIYPKPWMIDIAPPDHITLLTDTPLYRTQSEEGEPAAVLAPQEVKVTGAEKQWFYTNDPSSPAWIKIHTTWMGDLWAHIPVNRIGTVRKVENRRAHFGSLLPGTGIGQLMGVTPLPYNPAISPVSGDFNITAEFTTVYDRLFQVDTGNGTTWTWDAGIGLKDTNEKLELKKETPLLEDIWGEPKDKAVLQGETVTAFEKVDGSQYGSFNRGNPWFWVDGTWYHVRSSKGTGWINKNYAEPEGAVPVHWKVYVSDERELMRYPNVRQTTSTLLLRNETVEATAAWDQPAGPKWVRVTAEGHTGWVPLWNPSRDRIWDLDVPTIGQLSIQSDRNIWVGTADGGRLKIYDDRTVGFIKNGTEYWDAANALAGVLGYKVVKDSEGGTLKLSSGDYAFKLGGTADTAVVSWQGREEKSVKLAHPLVRENDAWYISRDDLRTLFGLSVLTAPNGIYNLVESTYTAEAGDLTLGNSAPGKMELQVLIYDWNTRKEPGEGHTPFTLSLEENGDAGQAAASREIPLISGTDLPDDAPVSYLQVRAVRDIEPGKHEMTAVLRVGERIIWKQAVTVAAE